MTVRTTVKTIQDIMRQDVGVDGDAQRLSQLCWMFFLKIVDDQDRELELLRDGYESPVPGPFQWRSWAADPEGLTGEDLLDFINEELFPSLKNLPAEGAGANRARVVQGVFEDAYNRYVKTDADEQALQGHLRAVEKKQLPHMLCVTNMLLHGIEDPSFVRHDNTLARPYVSYEQSDRVDIVLTNPSFGGREEDGIESNFPAHFRTRETADLFLTLIIRLLKPGGRAAVVLPDGSLFGEGVKTRLKEHLLAECNLHTIVRLPNSVFRPYASIGTNLLFFEKGTPTETVWYYEHRVPEGQKAYSMTRPIRLEHLRNCIAWWGGPERRNRQTTEQAWSVSLEEIRARNYNLDIRNPHTVEVDHGDPEELLRQLDEAERQADQLRDRLKAILAEALLR